MTPDRCRWFEDPGGRGSDPVAFPASGEAPPFCVRHILLLEPWVRSRVAAQDGRADDWIRWAKRRADAEAGNLKALGVLRDYRPVRPTAPERR